MQNFSGLSGLGCKYDHLGYVLLDPDYDFKDLGVMLQNNKKNRDKFTSLFIPLKYYGQKDGLPVSPFIIFEMDSKDNIELPSYLIRLVYPTNDSQYLCVQIDIKEKLLLSALTLMVFKNIQDIVSSKGYVINSALLHYYFGNSCRTVLDGGECGIITMNDWRIIDHAIQFQQEWKDRVMDVFYMNSFNKDIITKEALRKIIKNVGDKNIIESDKKIFFRLRQSKSGYLLNRIISMNNRNKIRQILQDENVCCKDESALASLFKI